MNEFALIEQIAQGFGGSEQERKAKGLILGIGDDCALYSPTSGFGQIVTTDTQTEGVHFPEGWQEDLHIGTRSAGTALSDIAAMGGIPKLIFSSLHLNTEWTEERVLRYFEGVHQLASRYGALIAGGNVVRSSGPAQFTLTIIGELEEGKGLFRHRAEPGDLLFLSGWTGSAWGGLRLLLDKETREDEGWKYAMLDDFRKPEPAIGVGRFVVERGLSCCGIDTSDGFLPDLGKLCEASGVGAELDERSLPITGELRAYCKRKGLDPVERACFGGDDYGLIFTVPAEHRRAIPPIIDGIRVAEIGIITEKPEILLTGPGHERRFTLPVQGFDHFA